ncbi:hypothetical protein C8Q80DRAFT_1301120 [Daedaleopsis nitida]|nr:hypothetical protein C8Q80DRAFT_1301120 [Daedaleopsis nitida]
MLVHTAYDEFAQALDARDNPTAMASTTTVFMPDLSFALPPASTSSLVGDYTPGLPSPMDIDATLDLFSAIMARSPADMFTPLSPEHETRPSNLQDASTTTSLPSHSHLHSHSHSHSNPEGAATPLAASPTRTRTLDTLVLPAGLREDVLPTGFRQQLADARAQPCDECSAHGRACVQTNAASWKCRECLRMARGHCDWHVRTVDGLGEEWTRPPVDMAARRRIQAEGVAVDRARDPGRPKATRKRPRARSSDAAAITAPAAKKPRGMAYADEELGNGGGGHDAGTGPEIKIKEEEEEEDELCGWSLFGSPPATAATTVPQTQQRSATSPAPSTAGASSSRPAAARVAKRRRAHPAGKSTVSDMLERIAHRVEKILDLLERIDAGNGCG